MPILDHMAHRRAALHREAQHWLLRLTSGSATMHDATAFEHWCGQSPAHVEAFAETRRLWENLGPAADASPHDLFTRGVTSVITPVSR